MTLELLRRQGAHRLSPVDFHYMEALERRIPGQAPNTRHILEGKLTTAVAAYQVRFEQVQCNAVQATAAVTAEKVTALGQLVQSMSQHMPDAAADTEASMWAPASVSRNELKSVRNFRNTWSKLSAQKQVLQAMGKAPQNAGPINSHMLVLRSLELMRDISPDYLYRFMSYADTLLCLDQADLSRKAAPVKPLASAKPKTRAPAKL